MAIKPIVTYSFTIAKNSLCGWTTFHDISRQRILSVFTRVGDLARLDYVWMAWTLGCRESSLGIFMNYGLKRYVRFNC